MATGVRFGSPPTILLQPGSYSRVDASALNFVPPFSFNVVCVLGAGLGGEPLNPYLFNDPAQAEQLFGAGTPLSDAIRFAFQGGANGGAGAVVGVRVDNAGQASGTLAAANGGAGLEGSFDDFGAYGNTFSVSFYPGTVTGTLAVIQGTLLDGTPYVQKFDNETSFSRLVERINRESPVTLTVTSGGTNASQTVQLATSQIDGRGTLIDGQGVTRTNDLYAYQYPATMLANTEDSMVVAYNGVTTWAIDSVDVTTNESFTTAANNTLVDGSTVFFGGSTLPPEITAGEPYIVREAIAADEFTLATPATPETFVVSAINTATDVLTVPGHTFSDGDVVQVAFAGTFNLVAYRNYFVRDVSGDDLKVASGTGDAAIDLSGSPANLTITKVAGGLLAISGSVAAATVSLLLGHAAISDSTPAEFNGVRPAARSLPTYTQSVVVATFTASAYSSDSARITLGGSETWGHLSKKGLPGSIFTIATGVFAGTYQVLHYEWDGLGADKVRIVRKLSGDRKIAPGTYTGDLVFYPQFHFGRLQPATTALESQLPANGLLAMGGQYITLIVGEKAYYYTTEQGDTIDLVTEALAELVNADAESETIASSAYNAGTYTGTLTITAEKPGTVPNGYKVQILVNVQTQLLVAANGSTLQGGSDPLPPRNAQGTTSGALILTNGFDSAPTYQRWLDGLDAIKYLPVRWIVPVSEDLGVQIATADHVTLASSTPKRRERMCVVGHPLGLTRQEVRDRAEVFQSERVVFVSPGFTSTDSVTGFAKRYSSVYMAAIVAGCLAAEGNGISDPITHTYLRNIIALEFTYQPGSVELDEMIQSGVLTIERDAALTRNSRGYRVTRAITTWRLTVNSAFKSNAFESISIINQSDFIAAAIREMQETLFIGTGIFPETLEAVRLAVNSELLRRTRERVIYGYDPKFTQVTLNRDSPNALDCTYKLFPVPALEFILNTQLLFPITAINQ